jgi:hypothetical protein
MQSSNEDGIASAVNEEMLPLRDLLREKRDLYARLTEVEAAIAVRIDRIRDLESL